MLVLYLLDLNTELDLQDLFIMQDLLDLLDLQRVKVRRQNLLLILMARLRMSRL